MEKMIGIIPWKQPPDEVLMKIDGRTISDDGQIELRGHELIQHRPWGSELLLLSLKILPLTTPLSLLLVFLEPAKCWEDQQEISVMIPKIGRKQTSMFEVNQPLKIWGFWHSFVESSN